jgi:hypothetical protein
MRSYLAPGLLICAVALAGCGDGTSSDFNGNLDQFFIEPATPLPEIDFQRRGKILALDIGARRLDPLHDRLPEPLRARQPGEVRTVALIQCEIRESGRYGYIFARAYSQSCQMRMIDAKSREFLANIGAGYPPPARVYLPFWPRTAARPTHLLLDSIQRLPNHDGP